MLEDGFYDYITGRKAILYTNDGPYKAIHFNWITQIRESKSKIGLLGSIPFGTNLDDLILIIRKKEGGGPAYQLTTNE
jgi:hypothetical protein